jgi:hypothetical protein
MLYLSISFAIWALFPLWYIVRTLQHAILVDCFGENNLIGFRIIGIETR